MKLKIVRKLQMYNWVSNRDKVGGPRGVHTWTLPPQKPSDCQTLPLEGSCVRPRVNKKSGPSPASHWAFVCGLTNTDHGEFSLRDGTENLAVKCKCWKERSLERAAKRYHFLWFVVFFSREPAAAASELSLMQLLLRPARIVLPSHKSAQLIFTKASTSILNQPDTIHGG